MTKVSKVYFGLSRESESNRGTGDPVPGRVAGVVGDPDGVGGQCLGVELVVVGAGMLVGELGLDGDRDPDLAAELTGEHLGDVGPQPALDEVLGELVRGGEQGGVLDDPHGTGEAQEGAGLRAGFVGQGVEHPVPDGGQILGLRGHRRLSTPPRALRRSVIHNRRSQVRA